MGGLSQRVLERFVWARRVKQRWPWPLFALTVAVMAVGRYTEYRAYGPPPHGWFADSVMGLAFMSFPAVGALIASRDRGGGFGWLLMGIGGGAAVLVASSGYAAWAIPLGHHDPLALLTAWIYQWLWFPLVASVATFLFLLFPTGTYPSPRWRWVGRATMLLLVLITVPNMVEDRLEGEGTAGTGDRFSIDNPIGVSFLTDAEEQLDVLFVGLFPLVILSITSLVFRYRGGDSVQRQQMKWVGIAAILFGAAVTVGEVLGLAETLFPVLLMMLPSSMAIAIFRYRLYDVDLIINKTLVYGLLSALLATAYLTIIVLLQRLLGDVTEQNDFAVAGSTLAVAALFRPLRAHVQAFIDRRFYRRKYNARLTLESFSSRLRDDVDLDHLAQDLTSVVRETMQPAHVSVWLRRPDSHEVTVS